MKKENKLLKFFMSGVITNNPSLVQCVGMCPLMAVSTSVSNGIGMGLAATAVLVCSNVVIAMLRKLIPEKIRIASFVVVIAGFVTMVDLLIQAYAPALSKSLGIFIPLIVVNCIIFARAEAFAFKNTVVDSFLDGLTMGIGFTAALIILSSIREILGNGTWLGISLFGSAFEPALLFILAPGGFLTLGVLIAAVQYLRRCAEKKGGKK